MTKPAIEPAAMLLGIVAGFVVALLWPRPWKQEPPDGVSSTTTS